MIYKYTFCPYSCYDQYTTKSTTDNVSNVLDRLLRVTTKITERFASDILGAIETFECNRLDHLKYDRIFLFREDGVDSYELKTDDKGDECILCREHKFQGHEDIQTWRLTYTPETNETIFIRVYAKEERVED